jgi:hypothetical protein
VSPPEEPRGLERPREYFRRALARRRLSHAYLFLGPEGSGKRRFALELASTLYCSRGEACGQCSSCLAIVHCNHAAVTVYGPEAGKSLIDIDTVRSLCERSHYARSGAFVAILEGAEALTGPAANALLKTLEEPPGNFIVILTAASSGALLPTLVSRCHRIYFSGPPCDDPAAILPEDVLAELARPEFFARYEPRQWLSRAAPDAALPEGRHSSRERVRYLLRGLLAAARRKLTSSSGADLDPNLDLLDRLLELRSSLDANVSPDLVFERCLAIFGAAKYP